MNPPTPKPETHKNLFVGVESPKTFPRGRKGSRVGIRSSGGRVRREDSRTYTKERFTENRGNRGVPYVDNPRSVGVEVKVEKIELCNKGGEDYGPTFLR